MKLAVGIPSRGLIHSRTIEQVLRNLSLVGKPTAFFITHDLPLPDSFNDITNRFVASDATHLWIVEEDMQFDDTVLSAMVALDEPIVTIDYPVSASINAVSHNNNFMLGGTGCILIAREVFDALTEPYWRCQPRSGTTLAPLPDPFGGWGHHDIDFYVRVQEAGFAITLLDRPGGQWRVIEPGEAEDNAGYHKISLL